MRIPNEHEEVPWKQDKIITGFITYCTLFGLGNKINTQHY